MIRLTVGRNGNVKKQHSRKESSSIEPVKLVKPTQTNTSKPQTPIKIPIPTFTHTPATLTTAASQSNLIRKKSREKSVGVITNVGFEESTNFLPIPSESKSRSLSQQSQINTHLQPQHQSHLIHTHPKIKITGIMQYK